jgi:hypothetical protein
MAKRTASLTEVLDAAFERVKRIDISEFELRADFSRYLCVLVSGYLEQSLRNAAAEYVRFRASPTVANFAIKSTDRISNLNTDRILGFLISFDPSWEVPLNALLVDEVKDAINSVVALRHGIAHGQPGDLTYERIARYYGQVKRAIAEIEKLMGIDP